MPTISLTSKAESDLDAIFSHYQSKVGSVAAHQIIQDILAAISNLELFPGMGRPSQLPGYRDLIFTSVPFYAAYSVVGTVVEIYRIPHQHSQRPEHW